MSEKQPPTVVEGATAGDVEEEVQPAKSAEDRKAASALASLDAGGDDSGSGQVDVDAAQKAIKGLGGATAAKKEVKNVKVDAGGDDSGSGQVDVDAAQKAIKGLGGATAAKKEVKNVKVDAADVALLVDELELTKPKATELLKANDGDAVKAMKASDDQSLKLQIELDALPPKWTAWDIPRFYQDCVLSVIRLEPDYALTALTPQ
ncbi:hypothetical protein CTAM01_08785 [Colletotrichum tamarilloi]|uniref:Nascent polypeptide-associated complex subunit alpha-like UBA domain-containing protein n=1 Tax=Colletotrichum tamarilloi TaxID=1209934 RepID=A0ABQ9R5H6_9PEZI|nr:uncharacterized protein CTAM01_08785 [Colletotrichum tamarilloi]KAK1494772.1 hypothetical protein CTAM01_08785 [Colletotrichum tamarilloi]